MLRYLVRSFEVLSLNCRVSPWLEALQNISSSVMREPVDLLDEVSQLLIHGIGAQEKLYDLRSSCEASEVVVSFS